jgi:hypothetical protein
MHTGNEDVILSITRRKQRGRRTLRNRRHTTLEANIRLCMSLFAAPSYTILGADGTSTKHARLTLRNSATLFPPANFHLRGSFLAALTWFSGTVLLSNAPTSELRSELRSTTFTKTPTWLSGTFQVGSFL